MNNNQFEMYCFALVICRNSEGKWLCVKEKKNRGWWIPGGKLDHGDDFYSAAIRETKEEAGIDVVLKGVLRIEESFSGNFGRIRVIFYAEPKDQKQVPKQIADSESEKAEFLTLSEIHELGKTRPGLRGEEITEYPSYIEKGGVIFPLGILTQEGAEVKILTSGSIYPSQIIQSISGEEKKGSLKDIEEELKKDENNPQNTNKEEVYKAIVENNVERIREFLLSGLLPDTRIIEEKEWTCFQLAINRRAVEVSKLLLIKGVDLSLITHKGRNSLHFLLQIDSNTENEAKRRQIQKLIFMEMESLSKEKRMIILSQKDVDGYTPLHFLYNSLKYMPFSDSFTKEDFSQLYKNLECLGADVSILKDLNIV